LNVLQDFDERIDRVLRIIGIATEVSRVYIFENDLTNEFSRNVYEWCAADVSAEIDNLQMVPFTQIREIIDTLLQNGQLVSSDIQTMEEETRRLLESQNIKAVVMHPLWVNHQFFGFIGYDECTSTRIWNDAELELLRAVSAVIANSYERRHTEREMLEERDRANRANQAKSEFLANMSHEIRTPMNAILGFSEILYERLDEPESRSMLGSVLSSGRALLSLLSDILDLSKIEAGKLELIRQPVTIRSLIQDIANLFQDKASRKGLTLTIDMPASVPRVIKLDEIRVKQVMFNLVGNAVKFTHRGFVRLAITFIPTNEAVGDLWISIKDTGIGIPSDQLTKIFDTFSQVSGRSARPYEGSGLGLSISKRLTEQMNGEILVESVEGIGSEFAMVLRGTEYSNDQLPFEDQSNHRQSMQFLKARVLIIDDVESNVFLVKSILGKLGLDIISATNGTQGIEVAQNANPNLIIMDLRMPGMDGFQAAEILKADPRTAEIPIIAYTAAVIEFNAHEKSNLFQGVLVKPIHKSELIYELSRFIPWNELHQTEPATYQIAQTSIEQITNEHNTALIRILEKDFLPRWNELTDQLVIYKIEAFGQDLKNLARTFDFAYLDNYAQELLQALDVLDLDQIQQLVSFFPEIILALNKRL
jgi:signal transduction histidine kinase/DNA-binding NarL/FixJ family response regulator